MLVGVGPTGPEITAVERETLTAGSETPLRHADGLGLWLAYRCVIENAERTCAVFGLPTPGT